MSSQIIIAKTDPQIRRCYPLVRELRPHVRANGFLERVRRQMTQGYRLIFLEVQGETRALAGYRISECLAWGKFLYVDDLITRGADRSRGYAGLLIDWLLAEAAKENCREFHLDSGVQRFAAHRFYLMKRLEITCHHFALTLPAALSTGTGAHNLIRNRSKGEVRFSEAEPKK